MLIGLKTLFVFYSEQKLMDQVNAVVGEEGMPPLENNSSDEGKTTTSSSKSLKKEGKMYVNKISPKPPPGF